MRFIKTPWLVKKLFNHLIWDKANTDNKIYLTFDDGPIPEVTTWVLSELKKYNAKATFFCIGDNIKKYPKVFQEVYNQGHSIGNHTFNHLNSWITTNEDYFANIALCDKAIKQTFETNHDTRIFRPPYGKIKNAQAKVLLTLGYKIIMWDVISYDFDKTVSNDKCLQNIVQNTKSGSIIVFHDSIKAFDNLKNVLPKALAILSAKGFVFEKL